LQNVEDLTFAGQVGEIRRMSACWREWAGAAGLSESVQHDGELCLNEAAANIILHGFGDSSGHEVSLRFELDPTQVRITLHDDGRPFNPLDYRSAPPPLTLEAMPVGGLGIGLIRSFTSDVQYRFEAGRNVLTLVLNR
jgi:serine/threonine-protein kinase RsbW